MKRSIFYLSLCLGLLVMGCQPAHEGHEPSPYAGQETRMLKALSAEDVEGYLSGQGMGFAMTAELNEYPGPKHVLALADELDLNDDQRRQTQQLFEEMEAAAIALGQAYVDKEHALENLFAEDKAGEEALRSLLHEIADIKADLRFTHLKAHVKQKTLLTPQQVAHYDQLRGYDADAPPGQHQHHEGMEH